MRLGPRLRLRPRRAGLPRRRHDQPRCRGGGRTARRGVRDPGRDAAAGPRPRLGPLPALRRRGGRVQRRPRRGGEFARQLAAVGAVGINLEDGLGPVGRHAAKIAAVRSAAPGLFVNARTDTYWSGDGDVTETLRRLEAYREAGADGVFVPGLTDPARIGSLAARFDVPLNVLYTPAGPGLAHLADLGVRRVSLGSLLYRRALGAALRAAADVRAGRDPGGPTPTYDEVRAPG